MTAPTPGRPRRWAYDAAMATQRSDDESPRYPVGAVDRALRLLLMFRDRPSVRIVDAARELGAAPSTVHRLLAMLMAHGLVTRDPDSQAYVPGEVLADLGVQVINQRDFIDVARPFMLDLVARFGETTNLGVLRRRDVLFVAEVESDHMVRIGNQLGRRIPAYHSSIGRVLLAELPLARLRALYPEATLRDEAGEVVLERADLEADLQRVLTRGYATNDQPRSLDFFSLAVPLRPHGKAIAGLAIAAPMSRLGKGWREQALAELRGSARAIEKALG